MSFVIVDLRREWKGSRVYSKRLNIKEQRSLRKGMAMGDIAMARGVCALWALVIYCLINFYKFNCLLSHFINLTELCMFTGVIFNISITNYKLKNLFFDCSQAPSVGVVGRVASINKIVRESYESHDEHTVWTLHWRKGLGWVSSSIWKGRDGEWVGWNCEAQLAVYACHRKGRN